MASLQMWSSGRLQGISSITCSVSAIFILLSFSNAFELSKFKCEIGINKLLKLTYQYIQEQERTKLLRLLITHGSFVNLTHIQILYVHLNTTQNVVCVCLNQNCFYLCKPHVPF
ncbi:hypothetical protein HanPSC8_Chr06g0248581 [Helianthus annuus]|nr:hypothetical protein HanPSC8_Chr06g0248581 [Helianthus annuus]